MHLVGFIIRIYHDARSPERQMPNIKSLQPHYMPHVLKTCRVMPNLRWVVIGFSQQRPGFIHRVVTMEYVVKNTIPVLGQIYLQILHLFPVNYHSNKGSLSPPWRIEKKNLKKTYYLNKSYYSHKVYYHIHMCTRIPTHTHTHACMKLCDRSLSLYNTR